MANNEMNGWISSMQTMLGSLRDHRVKASSISDVPEKLRKSKEEAYKPKVVSIGPLHWRTRKELLYMEEIKWRCMRSLLDRIPDPEESLREWSKAIYDLDEVVRASYANDIKFNRCDLAKIMLLDGCFLLELLVSNNESLDKAAKIKSGKPPSPGAEVWKKELVQSDLILLENQIPIFILAVLYQNLNSCNKGNLSLEGAREMVNGSALVLFGCSCNLEELEKVEIPNCAHLLELMHWFVTREEDRSGQENKTKKEDGISRENEMGEEDRSGQENKTKEDDGISRENNPHHSITIASIPKLELCATSLEAAGVTLAQGKSSAKVQQDLRCLLNLNQWLKYIGWSRSCCTVCSTAQDPGAFAQQTSSAAAQQNLDYPLNLIQAEDPGACTTKNLESVERESMSIRLKDKGQRVIIFGANTNFYISEGKRKLEIQPLHITETTEILWWNFIAWEQNRTTHEKVLLRVDNPTRCKFTQYALLFKDLVCCEHDVELLRNQEVLFVDDKKRSNEDVMNLFKNIVDGIDQIDASGDSRFDQLINDLNKCSVAKGNWSVFWHSCRRFATSTRYMCRESHVTLKRDYTTTVWKKIALLAATVLLGLTIAQTILAAISL